MFELLQYTFMQRALLSALLIGAVCAMIGVYVVLKGLSFIGAGVAHASFGGVALGFLMGVNPTYTAFGFCMVVAWLIGWVSEKGKIKEDTAVGIFFASTMALGILLIGFIKGYNIDLFGYIFGNILAVTVSDLWTSLVMAIIIISLLLYFYKELLFITFDPEMAEITGVPVRKLSYLLLSLVALTIVLSIKSVGVVLVSALIVTPAAAAYQLTDNFKTMMVLSIVIGIGSSVVGLLLSYWLDTSSGATIVLMATLIFFLSSLASPKRKRLKLNKRKLELKTMAAN
ncbi:MAG: metal ABC transporter permease [Candidatus Zhuqueibacterota bacterium]